MSEAVQTHTLRRSDESFLGRAVARFRRHRLAQAGLVVLLLLSLSALLVPSISPYTFDGQDPALLGQPTPPSLAHPMGTDQLGRDNATRILYGARISLLVGLASALIATFLGTVIGALTGFYGGWVELAMAVEDSDHGARELLSLGPEIAVTGPPTLRRRMAELAAAIARLHQGEHR